MSTKKLRKEFEKIKKQRIKAEEIADIKKSIREEKDKIKKARRKGSLTLASSVSQIRKSWDATGLKLKVPKELKKDKGRLFKYE